MGAPSDAHEERVRTLESLAMIAGFPRRVSIDGTNRPDVLQLDGTRRRLFLADAKATETSGCVETAARLRRYATGARAIRDAGASILFAVAHGSPHRSEAWVATVVGALREEGVHAQTAGSIQIDPECVLAWAVVPAQEVT